MIDSGSSETVSDHSVKHSRHLSGHPKKENAGRMPNAASTAQPAGPRAAGSMWLDAVLMIIPALAALAAALRHGPDLIDDAYMTFRYAENLASGCGMVFNRGEAVLGTTTPLMTILLALFKLAGVSIPLAARGLGIVSGMGVVVLMQLLALRSMGRLAAAALAVCIAVHPDLAFALNSGMETGLSTAAVYGALLLMLQGRYIPAGLIGGVAFLLRPDGLLIVLLSGGGRGNRRWPRRW
jgi:hypothetical protein